MTKSNISFMTSKSTIHGVFLLLALFMFYAPFRIVQCDVDNLCKDSYCLLSANCPKNFECKDGRILKNATKCGCCHVCVNKLEPDDECFTKVYKSLPTSECKENYKCVEQANEQKCVLDVNKACVKEATTPEIMQLPLGKPIPDCDYLGDYEPVQWKDGLLSFCVDKNGRRIFGTAFYKERIKMHCNCSRAVHKYGKITDPWNFPRCDDKGNYASFQCTDTYAFCLDNKGDFDGQAIMRNRTYSYLKCYDSSMSNCLTPCWQELKKKQEFIRNKINKDGYIAVLGVDLPNCDPDGSYSAVQCRGSECFCVQKNGEPYNEDRVPRYTKEAKSMTCNCLRDQELLKRHQEDGNVVTRNVLGFKCDRYGDYERVQCSMNQCFCVDVDGFQTKIKC